MKRLLKGLSLSTAAFVALSAMPVQAGPSGYKPINAPMRLTLNLYQCPDPGPVLSWTGTVVIDGQTYGWADVALTDPDSPPPPQPNDNFLPFEENWTIFTLHEGEDPHTEPWLACDDSRVVLAGDNTGWVNRPFTGKAEGEVGYAAGPFADLELGSRMFWNGKALGSSAADPCCVPGVSVWKATLHIN